MTPKYLSFQVQVLGIICKQLDLGSRNKGDTGCQHVWPQWWWLRDGGSTGRVMMTH